MTIFRTADRMKEQKQLTRTDLDIIIEGLGKEPYAKVYLVMRKLKRLRNLLIRAEREQGHPLGVTEYILTTKHELPTVRITQVEEEEEEDDLEVKDEIYPTRRADLPEPLELESDQDEVNIFEDGVSEIDVTPSIDSHPLRPTEPQPLRQGDSVKNSARSTLNSGSRLGLHKSRARGKK